MIEYTVDTLANGLRVVWHPDHNTLMAHVGVLYNVGARDESPERTGMAHLFEHLMFGGSANVPSYDAAIEGAGGVNNAWTSNDFTHFFDTIPAVNIETALWAESDRMLRPALSDKAIDIQRAVVIEEFKQRCLNQPYGDIDHHLRSLLFTTHPYRWPTIGLTPDHIAEASSAEVNAFFDDHYSPSNAILVISGNITRDKALRLAERYFGDIPARPVAPRSYLPEPPVVAPRRKEVVADVPAALVTVAYPMGGTDHPDYRVCDMITDVLANGRSARLTRDLVMRGDVVTRADASISGSEEPGYLMLRAYLRSASDSDIARAEELLAEQVDRLRSDLVPLAEMRKCAERFASTFTFGMMSYSACGEELAMAVARGEDINSRVDSYRAISPDRLREVARTTLDPSRASTLVYRPRS